MKRNIAIGALLFALSACGSDETVVAETTTTTAEIVPVTTTVAPTTTTTTVPPTTALDAEAQHSQNKFILEMTMNANMISSPEVVRPLCDMKDEVSPGMFLILIRGGLANDDTLEHFPGWSADDLANAYVEEFERIC